MTAMVLNEKYELNDSVKAEMKQYREDGGFRVPISYVVFHDVIADKCINQLRDDFGFKLNTVAVVEDGWGDKMEVARITGTTPTDVSLTLQYNPSNQHFMRVNESGGRSMLFEDDLV